jgi:hypothetical protein
LSGARYSPESDEASGRIRNSSAGHRTWEGITTRHSLHGEFAMPSLSGIRSDAELIHHQASDPQVKKLAELVASLAQACMAIDKTAKDAKRDAGKDSKG